MRILSVPTSDAAGIAERVRGISADGRDGGSETERCVSFSLPTPRAVDGLLEMLRLGLVREDQLEIYHYIVTGFDDVVLELPAQYRELVAATRCRLSLRATFDDTRIHASRNGAAGLHQAAWYELCLRWFTDEQRAQIESSMGFEWHVSRRDEWRVEIPEDATALLSLLDALRPRPDQIALLVDFESEDIFGMTVPEYVIRFWAQVPCPLIWRARHGALQDDGTFLVRGASNRWFWR